MRRSTERTGQGPALDNRRASNKWKFRRVGAFVAHTHNTVAATVDAAYPDIELVHRAAWLMAGIHRRKNHEQLVHELLDQLRGEKLTREARGLNHWDQHAPQFLGRLVRKARREKRTRDQEAEAFFRENHNEALAFAYAALKDQDEAEDVVAQTYVELLEGLTTSGHFFRALRHNILDRHRRRDRELQTFESAEEAFDPGLAQGDEFEDKEGSVEPPSPRLEDQDPLNLLIAREDHAENQRQIQKAKEIARGNRDYRWIRAKNWAQGLGIKATA